MAYQETQRIVVKFDGEAHEDHQISARMLGESLVGMADLMQAMRTVEKFKQVDAPKVEVEAFEEGSFEVVFLISAVGEAWQATRDVLIGPNMTALTTLGALVSLAFGGLDRLKRRGRSKVTSKELDPETGNVNVRFDNGGVEQMTLPEYETFQSPAVRAAAHKAVTPLNGGGTTIMNFYGPIEQVTITNAEAPNIVPEFEEVEDLQESTSEVWAEPLVASFDGEGKWRLSVEGRTVTATIRDEVFLDQVAAGRAIAKTDKFRILLHTVPYRTKTQQLRHKFYVDEVLEQRRGVDDDELLPGFEAPTGQP